MRSYDSIPYSPENIAKLEARALNTGNPANVERVYADVTVDPVELARHSSIFATDLASGVYDEGGMRSMAFLSEGSDR